MEKSNLLELINEVLRPLGFKQKGDYWVDNVSELTRIVHLQKSDFGDMYYINFGYILKNVPLNNLKMHVFNRVSSSDREERLKIEELLNLKSEIPDQERAAQLRDILADKLGETIQQTQTEVDLRRELENRQNLNAVPLNVKEYLGLESK